MFMSRIMFRSDEEPSVQNGLRKVQFNIIMYVFLLFYQYFALVIHKHIVVYVIMLVYIFFLVQFVFL